MMKNIGKALHVLLTGTAVAARGAVARQLESKAAGLYAVMQGSPKLPKQKYTGVYSGKRTTAAAQKRAKIKRANKRKNPKGSK